jgi:multidrug resistance protein, MATE family
VLKPPSLVRSLLGLAWPVALARLGIISMGVVDVMVVGQFVPHELPFQALAWSPTGVFMVGGIGLLTGVQVLASRAVGAGAPHEAGGAWRRGLVVSLVAGALSVALSWLLGERLFTAFGIAPELAGPATEVARVLTLSIPLHLIYVTTAFFLESIEKPLASTVAMWFANAVNLALNFALVPRFGAIGSAWCTVVARVCLVGVLGVYVWRMADAERYGVKRRARAPSYRALLKVGVAAAVSQTAEAGAFSGMTMLAGRLGANAVSTYQILLNLLSLVFMVSLGVSSATAVLTSAAVGRKDPREAKRASFAGLGLNAVLMLLAGSVVFTCAGPISRAYTANAALSALIASSLWLAALVMLPDGGQVVAAAGLRARGDNWFPTASHLAAYAVAMPGLAYWLSEVQGRGVNGLMLAVLAASILSYVVLGARSWRLRDELPPVSAN